MSSHAAALTPLQSLSGTRPLPSQRMLHSRIIGALFLAGFAAYGTGFALITSVISAPGFLTTIAEHKTTLALGALLMMLTIVTDVWRAIVFFPILGERGRYTALTYLAAQIISVVLFFLGALSLLLIVPLGEQAAGVGAAGSDWAIAIGSLLVHSNALAYQIAMMSLAFGSLALWLFGFRFQLIPRAFAGWAIVGYVALLAGTVAEVFGLHIGMWLQIPGGLFEIALPVWLFVKGFNADAYGKS